MNKSDYVTILKTENPCNKRVSRDETGQIVKEAMGAIRSASATTRAVHSGRALEQVIKEVGNDPCKVMILGFVPETEDGAPFSIITKAEMSRLLGAPENDLPGGIQAIGGVRYATRTKDTFQHSTWLLFDYDMAPGIPSHLHCNEPNRWFEWMCDIHSAFLNCGYVSTQSTSSRIMIDDGPAFGLRGFHVFMQTEKAEDIGRFGKELLIAAMGTEYGFMRHIFDRSTGAIHGQRPWSVFDPTTFGPERLVFVGRPTVVGDEFSILPTRCTVIEGRRLQTERLVISKADRQAVNQRHPFTVERSRLTDADLSAHLVDSTSLSLDTVVDTKTAGQMTIRDYWCGDYDKLRAQSPFRADSTSYAAFVSRHQDSSPFLFDSGTNTKYVLSKIDVQQFRLVRVLAWVNEGTVDEVQRLWLGHARYLSPTGRDQFLSAVQSKTRIGKRALNNELKGAQQGWDDEDAQQRAQDYADALEAEGRVPVRYSEDELPRVIDEVKRALARTIGKDEVFNFGGEVVAIAYRPPTTVRAIMRSQASERPLPEFKTVAAFTVATLRACILQSVSILGRRGPIGCPDNVTKAILDNPAFARPLTGLQTAPTVVPSGRPLFDPGYDTETGLYCTFDASDTERFTSTPTKADALQALIYLRETVFADFPFKSELDFVAAIAMLFTAMIRRFLVKAPGFLISATTQSSGKSSLVDLIFRVVYGTPAVARSWTDNQEEMAKNLLAILREGHSGICFDNLPFGHKVDGDELSKVITQEEFANRRLGVNETQTVPTNMLVALTGNQLVPVNDMVSRLLTIYLEPNVENPENRNFNRPDIESWALEERDNVIHAVLTIFLAWHDREDREPNLLIPSRFPEWDQGVRAVILWLGLPDLMPKFFEAKQHNEAEIANATLVEMLFEKFGDRPFVAADVFTPVLPVTGDPKEFQQQKLEATGKHVVFLNALKEDVFNGEEPNARRLGNRLRFLNGRIYSRGLKLEQIAQSATSNRSKKYRILDQRQAVQALPEGANDADDPKLDAA